MAQPTAYNKTRNFTDWQASNPNTVFTGADMDQEFDDIETTLDETLDNLAMIQRDDGALANATVHPDAFSAASLSLIASDWTPRGLWVTATAYVVGDVVEKDIGSYVCSTAHTSGVFATDHTAGKWIVISASNTAADIVSTPVGSLAASDVQSALQELDADLTAHIGDAVDAHDATAISYQGSAGLAATTVEAALDELDTEKAATASAVMDGDAAGGDLTGTYPNPTLASGIGFTTGDVKLSLKTSADAGWVLMDDKTIGNGASAATGRANADTESLFTLLWNNITDAYCPVSTGRGASAAADFAANKTLTLPRTLGRSLACSGTGSGLTARTLGQYIGAETETPTVAKTAAHAHPSGRYASAGGGVSAGETTAGAHAYAAFPSQGGGSAYAIMQPSSFMNVMIKL